MPKAIWKGEISFGLISIPVSLYSIEENKEIHFHLLDAKSKTRIRYQRINEETGKEVPWSDIVKGYEYEKDHYIIVNEEQFEKASPELFKGILIEEFVDLKEIDSLYLLKPYYLIPESKNKKAYVLFREALKQTSKVAVAKVIIRSKESVSLILAHQNALILYLIHYADEIREEKELSIPQDDLKAYKISPAEIKMATSLIKEMSTQWQPEKYHNEYRETLQKWLEQQIAKQEKKIKKGSVGSTATTGSVVDFITLLKESMKKSKEAKNQSEKKTPAAKRK